jgi:hypothetical protein
MGGVRPHLDYAQPTGPSKRAEHSAGPREDCQLAGTVSCKVVAKIIAIKITGYPFAKVAI